MKRIGLGQRAGGKPTHKLLYVEDITSNLVVVRLNLQEHYDVLHAPDDRTACELMRQRGEELCAILMDIELQGSVLSGVELARLAKGRPLESDPPEFARNLPVLEAPLFFLTAYAADYSEEELRDAGASKILHKPVDFAELNLALTHAYLGKLTRA